MYLWSVFAINKVAKEARSAMPHAGLHLLVRDVEGHQAVTQLLDGEMPSTCPLYEIVSRRSGQLAARSTGANVPQTLTEPCTAPACQAAEDRLVVLTGREPEVADLVGRGMSNDEIEAELSFSPATARTHVSHAMVRLGARDRAQLGVVAYQTGLVSR